MHEDACISIFNDRFSLLIDSNIHDNNETLHSLNDAYIQFYENFIYQNHDVSKLDSESLSPIAPLSDFMRHLYQDPIQFGMGSGILPPGLLYLDEQYLVFERPPSYQNISLIPRILDDIDYSRNKPVIFRLPIPWQVYIVNFVNNRDEQNGPQLYTANVRMLFSQSPIQSLDQLVYLPALNNFYTNGSLCRPMYDSIDDIERFTKDIAGVIQSSYDWVWNSGTNLDLTNCIVQLYLQFRDSNFENTIFAKADDSTINYVKDLASHFNHTSYYCSYAHVGLVYREWEKFTLDEIVNVSWPNPSESKSFTSDLSHQSLSTQLIEYAHQYLNLSEEQMHYDEEEDRYHICGDMSCYCIGGEDFDEEAFIRDIGLFPPAEKTLRKSLIQFIKETEFGVPKVPTHHFFRNLVTRLNASISGS